MAACLFYACQERGFSADQTYTSKPCTNVKNLELGTISIQYDYNLNGFLPILVKKKHSRNFATLWKLWSKRCHVIWDRLGIGFRFWVCDLTNWIYNITIKWQLLSSFLDIVLLLTLVCFLEVKRMWLDRVSLLIQSIKLLRV
jgi:hypothetical protein